MKRHPPYNSDVGWVEELATKPNETRHTLLGFAALNTNLRNDRTPRSPYAIRGGGYFSSLELLPSSRLATINNWICWVPSKMSRIFESRAHFSSSSSSP